MITIEFRSAEGLEAGRTKLKYKEVEIGLVRSIQLTPDRRGVEVQAELKSGGDLDKLLVSDTRFWVMRPHVGAEGVSGLGTLLSGAYIGMDIGHDKEPRHRFQGLESPPPITTDVPGRRFVLKAKNLGSLNIGSPVYFRRVKVGQVVSFDLDHNGREVSFGIFVEAPYDRFVTSQSRFWNASGLDVSLGADGIKINTESLISVVSGGIAFQDLSDPGDPEGAAGNDDSGPSSHLEGAQNQADTPSKAAAQDAVFSLYANRQQALKHPDRNGHDFVLLFSNSVRGLSIGAPVDFRGLTIGEVVGISIDHRPGIQHPVPQVAVTVRVYPHRFSVLVGDGKDDDSVEDEHSAINPMVAKGFRAQLRNGNLLTGQLFVALDFFPRTAPARIDWSHNPAIFPTISGSFDSLQDSLVSIAEKIDRLPLQELTQDLRQTLQSTNRAIQHVDALVLQVNEQLSPEMQRTLEDARGTLNRLNQSLDNVNGAINPQGPLTQDTRRSLQELGKAAQSLREMADYLQRHPESILRGKPEDPKP
ncbi:MAG: MCE family protein [Burkholderiaceae bacterium]|nr:MCE family protein [Burkholderiaceae bacterium]